MLLYVKIICFLIMELALFFLYGKAVAYFLKLSRLSIPYLILIGYFASSLLFFIVDIPLKIMQAPLLVLSIVWVVCNVLLVLFHLIFWRKIKIFDKSSLGRWKTILCYVVGGGILAVVLLSFIVRNGTSGSPWDNVYYIGDVSTSVYTNTISCFDAYTGVKLKTLHTEYFFEILENRNAVISQLFGIHPLITTGYIQTGITVLLYLSTLFAFGRELFADKVEKIIAFAAIVSFAAWFSYGLVTQSGFLFFRPSEGKTMQAVVLIPFLYLQFYRILQNQEDKAEWYILFLFLCAGFGINMSSLFLHPALLSATLLTMAISRKNLRIVKNWMLCLIPYIVIGAGYLAMRNDWIQFYVK